MGAQKPTDPFGSTTYEIRASLRRFWGLSWWWKGSILGVIAAVIVVPGVVIALAGGNGDDSAVLELTQEPTPTAAVATPTPIPTRIPTPTPTPITTPTPEPPTPTPIPEPPAQEEQPPPQQQQPAPQPLRTPIPVTVQPLPVTFMAQTEVLIEVQMTQPGGGPRLVIVFFGKISTETQCEHTAAGGVSSAVTTINISPDPFWESWEGAPLTYTWSVDTGSISGSGLTATWTRLIESGQITAGKATLTVTVGTGGDDGFGHGALHLDTCE